MSDITRPYVRSTFPPVTEEDVTLFLAQWLANIPARPTPVTFAARESVPLWNGVVVVTAGSAACVHGMMKGLALAMGADGMCWMLHVAAAHHAAAASVLALDDARTWSGLFAWAEAHGYPGPQRVGGGA